MSDVNGVLLRLDPKWSLTMTGLVFCYWVSKGKKMSDNKKGRNNQCTDHWVFSAESEVGLVKTQNYKMPSYLDLEGS